MEADLEPKTITLLPSELMNNPYHSETYSLQTPTSFFNLFTSALTWGITSVHTSSQSISWQMIQFQGTLLDHWIQHFDNICYMFTSIIFDTVVQVYTFSPKNSALTFRPEGPPAPTAEVNVLGNANILVLPTILPTSNQAGHWFNILILDPIVKSTIVTIVVNKFKAERENYVKDIA